jgi:hypothetical protein
MVHVDMTASDAPTTGPQLARVSRAEFATSRSGSPMLVLELERARDATPLCRDWIVLAGRGWDAFGKAKLQALGVAPDFDGDLEPEDLVGRRVLVHLVEKEAASGRVYLNVDTDQGEFRGYDLPDAADASPAGEEDAPF